MIKLIESGASFTNACSKLGISRSTEWRERQQDPKYKKQIEEAKDSQIEIVENRLFERCMDGNITAIIFYLKTHKPKKYHLSNRTVPEGDEPKSFAEWVKQTEAELEEKMGNKSN